MKTTSIGLLLLCSALQSLNAADLRVLCTNGIKSVVSQLIPEFEKTTGRKLDIEFASTVVLRQKIESGAAFDIAILTSTATDDLMQKGKIAAKSRSDIGSVGIGMGIRAGAKKPDISTPEAMKKTVLAAKSIAITVDGASREYVDKMFERMNIAAEVKPKLKIKQDGEAPPAVANGEAELVFTLIHNLKVPGVDIAGPLPGDYQHYVVFSASLNPRPQDAEGAKALVTFLTGPKVLPALQEHGMQSVAK